MGVGFVIFERLCQRILRESRFTKVEVTGKNGDGGINGTGLLRMNLVSFTVRFQCKKYKDSVGRQMIADEQALLAIDKLNVPRLEIFSVTHVDYPARVRTVHEETNSRCYARIKRFKEITGCPVAVNTSFNVRASPSFGHQKMHSDALREQNFIFQ